MTRRAYRPKPSTRELVRAIEALDGIARVDIIAPHRGVTVTPVRLKVTTEGRDGSGAAIFTIFTLSEARAWLATEQESPLQRMQREERTGLAGSHVNHTTGA